MTYSLAQTSIMKDDDEIDIDLLADNAVNFIKHSKVYAHPKAFFELHKRLLKADDGSSNNVVLKGVGKDLITEEQCKINCICIRYM